MVLILLGMFLGAESSHITLQVPFLGEAGPTQCTLSLQKPHPITWSCYVLARSLDCWLPMRSLDSPYPFLTVM
jgi:hypothetical protein